MITAILAIIVLCFDVNIYATVFILSICLYAEIIISIQYLVIRNHNSYDIQKVSKENTPNFPKLSAAQAMRDSLNTGDKQP